VDLNHLDLLCADLYNICVDVDAIGFIYMYAAVVVDVLYIYMLLVWLDFI
jgi:hypothetical protein